MKHLLLITPGFAANEDDSRCIPPLQLYVQHLQQQGDYQLTVLALRYPYHDRQYQWNGIPTYVCYKKGILQKFRTWWQAQRWLKVIHRQQPIDGIHSFWLNDSAMLGQRFSRQLGVPHWVTLMGQDVRASNRYLSWLPLKKLQLVALSDFHQQQLLETTGQQAQHIIPWGVERQVQLPSATGDGFDILGVGNLIDVKNYQLFIRLLARLKEAFPHLKAGLIGDGPERKILEQQAKEAGLGNRLHFFGYISRQEVLQHMANSRIFLHTSTFESFGYVLLEALACGQEVVSTPVGMAMSSSLCKVGHTEEELFQHLSDLLATPFQRAAHFPHLIEDTLEQYLALYKSSL